MLTCWPGREEVVPTFALPWSTGPPIFPTSIESTELQVLRDSQAKWLPIWSTMLLFLSELLMRGPYLPCIVPRIHDHGSYASRNNAWKEYHVVVAGWRRQPLKLQNITCQYLGGLSKKWDDPTPGNGKKHPNRDTKLWSLESWDHRIILNDT